MPNGPEIFRRVALDRLSSPEELDRVMTVTSRQGWIALAAVGAVLGALVAWGIFGSMPRAVNGQGILIRGGAVYDVVAVGSGVVTQLCVQVDQTVRAGDTVAFIEQPELLLRIRNTEMVLNDLRQQHVRLMVVEHDTLRIDLASLQQERTNLVVSLGNYDKQIDTLLRKLDRQREALKQGLIVESAFLTTEIDLFSTQQAKAQAELKLTQMEATEKNERTQVEQQSTARQQRIDETQHALDLLKKQLELSSIVTSPYAGRVLEVTVDEGNLIASGKRILSLEKVEQDLEAVVFVPAREGKRVKPEMTVRVYPSTVAKTTSGCMMGKVSSVSPFPSTPEGMMRVLRNEELARQMGARGAPIEVHVQLEKTADRAYRWSSGRVTASVNSGTLCDASIIIEEVRPLSLVVPLLKDYVGAN